MNEKKLISAIKELHREFAVVVDGKVVEFTTQDILDLIHRLKAEIERLTEENGYLDGCAKQFLADYQKCEIERAEIQKQVDELKENQVIECHGMLKGCDMVKQAVKDTAKEILQELYEYLHEYHEKKILEIARRKGVEVD